jgi:hypothetical protein
VEEGRGGERGVNGESFRLITGLGHEGDPVTFEPLQAAGMAPGLGGRRDLFPGLAQGGRRFRSNGDLDFLPDQVEEGEHLPNRMPSIAGIQKPVELTRRRTELSGHLSHAESTGRQR